MCVADRSLFRHVSSDLEKIIPSRWLPRPQPTRTSTRVAAERSAAPNTARVERPIEADRRDDASVSGRFDRGMCTDHAERRCLLDEHGFSRDDRAAHLRGMRAVRSREHHRIERRLGKQFVEVANPARAVRVAETADRLAVARICRGEAGHIVMRKNGVDEKSCPTSRGRRSPHGSCGRFPVIARRSAPKRPAAQDCFVAALLAITARRTRLSHRFGSGLGHQFELADSFFAEHQRNARADSDHNGDPAKEEDG